MTLFVVFAGEMDVGDVADTESPLAQMKPGFNIVALLTHFQLPLDRSWHSALAPFLEPA